MNNEKTKHFLKLGIRLFNLYFNQVDQTKELVKTDYDEISNYYDTHWTKHMHEISEEMIYTLKPQNKSKSLDLTCGTGFVTAKIFDLTNGDVTGVDISEGMIKKAKENYKEKCKFIQSNAIDYLKKQPKESFDNITCAWGLGYLEVNKFLKEIRRVLKPGGKIGIIDNSTFSNWEMIWFLILALSEKPDALKNIIKSHYVLSNKTLSFRLRLNQLRIISSWKGEKTFYLFDKKEAINQFIRSGAAAGFLQAIDEKYKDEIINRTAEFLIKYKTRKNKIPIMHRYIAVVGEKKMKNKLVIVQLDNSDKNELIKIIINSFTKSPQLPYLIKKPSKTGKFIIYLIGLNNSTGKVKMFGIKKDDKLLCCGYCVDSDAKPNFLNLLKFGFKIFVLLGFKGIKEVNLCSKNKPKYEKKCLELMLFGTIDSYQKKGFGKLMLNFLYDYSKKNDYGGVTGVTNKSKPPHSFYKKEGWVDDITFKIDNYKFCWVRKIV